VGALLQLLVPTAASLLERLHMLFVLLLLLRVGSWTSLPACVWLLHDAAEPQAGPAPAVGGAVSAAAAAACCVVYTATTMPKHDLACSYVDTPSWWAQNSQHRTATTPAARRISAAGETQGQRVPDGAASLRQHQVANQDRETPGATDSTV